MWCFETTRGCISQELQLEQHSLPLVHLHLSTANKCVAFKRVTLCLPPTSASSGLSPFQGELLLDQKTIFEYKTEFPVLSLRAVPLEARWERGFGHGSKLALWYLTPEREEPLGFC